MDEYLPTNAPTPAGVSAAAASSTATGVKARPLIDMETGVEKWVAWRDLRGWSPYQLGPICTTREAAIEAFDRMYPDPEVGGHDDDFPMR